MDAASWLGLPTPGHLLPATLGPQPRPSCMWRGTSTLSLRPGEGVQAGGRGGPWQEPGASACSLNIMTASYLHSSSFENSFSWAFLLIPHNSNSSRPRHYPPWRRHGPSLPLVLPPPCPPSSIPGVRMGLAPRVALRALGQWNPVSGLWVRVMVMGQGHTLQPPGPLCLPGSEPGLAQPVFSDAGWVLGAQRKSLSTGEP